MLKNRFIKTATYEGFYKEGLPTEELIRYHERLAAGGVGLTTVSYGAVNNMGRTHSHQMIVNEQSKSMLKSLTTAVHRQGGAVSIQLTHAGFFSSNRSISPSKPLAPSRTLNLYGLLQGLGISKAMTRDEIIETTLDFAEAAKIAKEAGFDAVELHMGHGYLLSQFISPYTNRRKDDYGGDLQNRMRFPMEVVDQVRNGVGKEFPVLCKINLRDGFNGGLEIDEAIIVAQMLEEAEVNALVLSGGFTSKTPFYLMRGDIPAKEMIEVEKDRLQRWALRLFGHSIIKKYDFEENFFLPHARKIRARVKKVALVYLGGVTSTEGISRIMSEGFDMVAIGRALIHNPDFVIKVREENHTSPCDHCNKCVAEMDRDGIRCVLIE